MKNTKEKKEEKFIKKDIKLSGDFSHYVSRHQDIFKGKPKNPYIIITDSSDREYNQEKIKLSREINSKNCFIADKSGSKWELSPS